MFRFSDVSDRLSDSDDESQGAVEAGLQEHSCMNGFWRIRG